MRDVGVIMKPTLRALVQVSICDVSMEAFLLANVSLAS